MRFNLDSVFVADKGLIVIGIIVVIYSIICFIGVYYSNYLILIMVFYNSALSMIFLSIFALGALNLNDNIIDWIDNHWDLIRNKVFSFNMNKFKDHVTTEINALGIFSLTINATLIISMICISNLIGFKNVIRSLSYLSNLIFSVLSTGLILIGFYSKQHGYYTNIPTWSSNLLIVLGVILFLVGLLGYYAEFNMKKKYILYHIIVLIVCIILLIISCISFFFISKNEAADIVNENWNIIHENLIKYGYQVRKSFFLNQIEINFKFAGFYSLVFILFSFICLGSSFYTRSLIY
jgi:hypothetical protein